MTDRGVCVVTHPLGSAGENATRTLLDILGEITSVSLVTADLPVDSSIRNDHEVIELTKKGTGDTVPIAVGRFLLNQLRMCAVIYRRSEGIVLFFGATAYLLPILFARIVGKTVLVEPRGDVPLTLRLNWERRMPSILAFFLAGSVRTLERAGFIASHKVVTYTPNMARELGLDPDSSRVFPNGARYVDTKRFQPKVAFNDRDAVVGFVGRLDEEKGIRKLADVAKLLPEDITFRFVGDGPLYNWLERELSQEIRTGQIELTGWVDHEDVPCELSRMRLLVMPSQPTEGLPTTILEAMACGTPAYATPISGIPDVVQDGQTGWLIDNDDPRSMANEIIKTMNSTEICSISKKGRDLIHKQYSFEQACNRYEHLLSEAI